MEVLKNVSDGMKILAVIAAIALVIFAMPAQASFF